MDYKCELVMKAHSLRLKKIELMVKVNLIQTELARTSEVYTYPINGNEQKYFDSSFRTK